MPKAALETLAEMGGVTVTEGVRDVFGPGPRLNEDAANIEADDFNAVRRSTTKSFVKAAFEGSDTDSEREGQDNGVEFCIDNSANEGIHLHEFQDVVFLHRNNTSGR